MAYYLSGARFKVLPKSEEMPKEQLELKSREPKDAPKEDTEMGAYPTSRWGSIRIRKSIRIAKPIKTSPDTSPSTFHNPAADKAFRYDGPTYVSHEGGTKRKRKTPGAVNDGSKREDPSVGGAATTGPISQAPSGGGGGGGGGGMGAAGSLRIAAIDRLILRRSGFKTYEGSFNGKKIRVQAEELVEKGSYPGNRRQKRRQTWRVDVDGDTVGEAPSFREARQLAFAACVKFPDGSSTGCDGPGSVRRSAGIISVIDTQGQEHTTYIEQAKPGDRVRFKRGLKVKSEGGGMVEIEGGMMGEVQAVNPSAPSLTVFVRGVSRHDRGKEMKIGRHSVTVPAEEVALILSTEDPRVA
jgi:hypothetical protein